MQKVNILFRKPDNLAQIGRTEFAFNQFHLFHLLIIYSEYNNILKLDNNNQSLFSSKLLMLLQTKNKTLMKKDTNNSSYSIVDESIHSFGRQKKQFLSQIHDFANEQQESQFLVHQDLEFKQDNQNWSSSSTGEFGIMKSPSLCCRTYFTQNETISQPESMIFEFKGYTFPFSKIKNDMIKKTMCAFLNCIGGFIFIGIEQNVYTKQHKVRGSTFTEAQKQQMLKVMRKNAQFIQPQIIVNRKMQISFVPVKNNYYPYPYIPGRFVVKIKISPGIRDELYTVKNQQNQYFICIRTQNQVITYDIKKDPRKALSIQKQRAQFPIEQPTRLHKYQCRRPEQGARIFKKDNKMLKKTKNEQIQQRQFQQTTSPNRCQQNKQINTQRQQFSRVKQKFIENKANQSYSSCNTKSGRSYESSLDRSINHSNIKDLKGKKCRKNKSRKKNKKNQNQQRYIKIDISNQTKKETQLKTAKIISLQKQKKSNKSNKMDIIKNCERIVERYYDTKSSHKTTQEFKNQEYQSQGNSIKKQRKQNIKVDKSIQKKNVIIQMKKNQCGNQKLEKIQLHENNFHSHSKSKSKSKQNDKRKVGLQHKISYLERYIKTQFLESYIQTFREFVMQLLSTNFNTHRIFGFTGFSSRRVQGILNQFTNIDKYSFFQFENLLVYKFNKETDESQLKLALTKAIQNQNLNMSESYNKKNVEYRNTDNKKGIHNKKLLLQQSSLQSNSGTAEKKKVRIVFKLTTRLRIIAYNMLNNNQKSKIKETAILLEDIYQKKNHYQNLFFEEKSKQAPKFKQVIFPNLYYSLLAYLQLKRQSINIIFC